MFSSRLSARATQQARTSLSQTRRRVSTTATAASTGSNTLRNGLYATLTAAGATIFAVYYSDSRSALHRYVLTPVIRNMLDAETSHKLSVQVLAAGLGPKDRGVDDEVLGVELWGQTLSSPIGLAAGYDKNGEAIDGLLDLGFSWVEIGSVTPRPQAGNPMPRVFHLPVDEGLINRYGFPSKGHSYVLSNLRSRVPLHYPSASAGGIIAEDFSLPASGRKGRLLAVNLGKNKTSAHESPDDFVRGVKTFGEVADVLVVNVSSPNTPGLRDLQSSEPLKDLLSSVVQARDSLQTGRKPKILLKVAPDLSEGQIADMAKVISSSGIDGVIVSNTTTQRPSSLRHSNKSETGGLSGAPLKPFSLATLSTMRKHLPSSMPIIGCGGIQSGQDAIDYARAGATLVQMYTGFGYAGAGAPRRVKDEVTAILKKEGKTWNQLVSQSVRSSAKTVQGSAIPKTGVGKLIDEAEELKKLLDGLGDRMDAERKAPK